MAFVFVVDSVESGGDPAAVPSGSSLSFFSALEWSRVWP